MEKRRQARGGHGSGGSSISGWCRACNVIVVACLFAILLPVVAIAVDERRDPKPPSAPRDPGTDIRLSELEKLIEEKVNIKAVLDSTLAQIEIVIPELALFPPDTTKIHAVEITIDRMGGITVVDRNGRTYRKFGGGFDPVSPIDDHDRDRGAFQDIVHIGSDVTVEAGEFVRGNVTSVFGDVTVEGEVSGSAVSIFGNVDVDGEVGEDGVAPFGRVSVGSEGMIRGNVVGIQIHKAAGGRIGGVRNEILFDFLGEDWQPISRFWTRTTVMVLVIVKVLFWLFLALIAHVLACKNIVKVKRKLVTSPIKSFLVGIAAQVLLLPAVLVLLVTIIGIPVAVFLVPILIVAAMVLAYAAAGLWIGEKIDQNSGIHLRSPLSQTVVGLALLQSLSIIWVVFFMISSAEGSGGGPIRLIVFALGGLSIFLGYVVITAGSGAVVMTRFGTRPKGEIACDQSDADAAVGETETQSSSPTPLPERPSSAPPQDDSGTAPAVGQL